jgi:hypothetical protein
VTGALFAAADGDRWTATELSRGPWDPLACHGGPVAALLARAVEGFAGPDGARADTSIEWQIARITIELTRPVPVGRPLEVVCDLERPGKRVSLVAVRLLDDGTEVARARALRIRDTELPLPEATVQPVADPPGAPDDAPPQRVTWATTEAVAFHADACEHRFTEGAWDVPGPVGVWIRLLVPVVEGERPSGLQRAVAAGDFGNGVSAGLPYDDFLFINPDLTVHLLRPPVGEWIGMRTASHYSGHGAGMAESALYDLDGRVGRSVQSLFVDAR